MTALVADLEGAEPAYGPRWKPVQISVSSVIKEQSFSTQNAPQTVCQPDPLSSSTPNRLAGLGRASERYAAGLAKLEREEGISGENGEGTEGEGM